LGVAEPVPTTIRAVLDRYDGVLLDAFGVLIDGGGALPGAAALIAELSRRGKPYAIVSNDASRSRTTFAKRFASFGLAVGPEHFVTSGTLLPAFFRQHPGARTLVLGTDDSCAFVEEGGAVVLDLHDGVELDAVAVCDDGGTPFLDGMEIAISAIVRAVRAGRRPILVCPNPDLVYPKSPGEYGLTAGAMAVLIETALARLLPGEPLAFERLGKPEPHLMRGGAEHLKLPLDRVVMIGDQLETDIAGANAAGIASALVAGVSRWEGHSAIAPTHLLATIEP
jgi:HAD superfamily hydrolase (TIGR01450 family)